MCYDSAGKINKNWYKQYCVQISKLCWKKETLHKRVHSIWLHLYEILELKLIYAGKKSEHCPSGSVEVKTAGERRLGNFLRLC